MFRYDPSVSTEIFMIDNNPVIHTRLRVIAVTDVAGRQGDYNSVKARVTTLKCKFYLPEDYVRAERMKQVERILCQRRLRELMEDEATD